MPSAFPSDSDLDSFFASIGIQIAALPGATTIATEEFERDTMYRPWIAVTETRSFAGAEGRLLDLRSGILTVSEVRVDDEVVPTDRYALRSPRFLQFAFDVVPPKPGYVTVAGTWGYAQAGPDAVPQDAWNAVLFRAAAITTRASMGGTTDTQAVAGPLTSVSEGTVSYHWDAIGDIGNTGFAYWDEFYHRVVRAYTLQVGAS